MKSTAKRVIGSFAARQVLAFAARPFQPNALGPPDTPENRNAQPSSLLDLGGFAQAVPLPAEWVS